MRLLLCRRLMLFAILVGGDTLWGDGGNAGNGGNRTDFLTEYRLYYSESEPGESQIPPEKARNRWRPYGDPVPFYYDFPLPGSRREMKDQAYLRRAAEHFGYMHELIRKIDQARLKYSKPDGSFRQELWWKKIDEEERLERLKQRVVSRTQEKITLVARKILDDLQQVRGKEYRSSEAFRTIKSVTQRKYVIYEVNLGDLVQALPVLEDYMRDSANSDEWPAHRYRALILSHMLRSAKLSSSSTKAQTEEIREQRNRHLLRAVELRYGSDSEQFQTLLDKLSRNWPDYLERAR